MAMVLDPISEPIAPTEAETAGARQSSRALAKLLQKHAGDTLLLHIPGEDTEVAVTGAAIRVLSQVLEEMGKGNAVTVLSARQELTPQQAANFLGMSRTLLTSVLDRQEIPFRYVGSHRRIRFHDLLAFRAEQERRHQAMNELTAQAQELNMGY